MLILPNKRLRFELNSLAWCMSISESLVVTCIGSSWIGDLQMESPRTDLIKKVYTSNPRTGAHKIVKWVGTLWLLWLLQLGVRSRFLGSKLDQHCRVNWDRIWRSQHTHSRWGWIGWYSERALVCLRSWSCKVGRLISSYQCRDFLRCLGITLLQCTQWRRRYTASRCWARIVWSHNSAACIGWWWSGSSTTRSWTKKVVEDGMCSTTWIIIYIGYTN